MPCRFAVLAVLLCSGVAHAQSVEEVVNALQGQYLARGANADADSIEHGGIDRYTYIRHVDVAAIGAPTLYVEERYASPEGRVGRQFLLVFSEVDGRARSSIYTFADGRRFARADAVPERLLALKPEDVSPSPPECGLLWSARDEIYIGAVDAVDCGARRQAMPVVAIRLSAGREYYEEGRYDAAGHLSFDPSVSMRHARLARPDLDAEVEGILDSFEGAFENSPPVSNASPGAEEIASLYTFARRVRLPSFGSYVMYVEFRRGSADGAIELQRLITFDDSPQRRVNVMRSFNFRPGNAFGGAHLDPKKLGPITRDDLEQLPVGCEHIWRSNDAVWIGTVTRETCHFFVPSLNQWRHVSLEYLIDQSALHMWERGYDDEGRLRFGTVVPVRFPRTSRPWP